MRSSSRLANAYNKPIIVTSDFKLDIKVIFPIIVKNWEASRTCATLCVKKCFLREKDLVLDRIDSIRFYHPLFSILIAWNPFSFSLSNLFQSSHVHGKIQGKATRQPRDKGKGLKCVPFLITCREERCSKRKGKFTTETFEKVRKCDKNLMKLA